MDYWQVRSLPCFQDTVEYHLHLHLYMTAAYVRQTDCVGIEYSEHQKSF